MRQTAGQTADHRRGKAVMIEHSRLHQTRQSRLVFGRRLRVEPDTGPEWI